MAVEGAITIEIKASTDKFDKQIANLEKKMKDTEKEKIEIDTQIKNFEEQKNQFEEARQKANEYKVELEKLKQVQQSFPSVVKDPTSNVRSPEYEKVKQDIAQTSALLQEQNKIMLNSASTLDLQDAKYQKLKSKQQQLNAKVSEYKQKIENVKIQKQVADVEKLKNGFNGVGSSIQTSINKVARLALGIFGVRSAYMALRRASSDLATYDQQYATNLEYIRYALTQTIAPVLRYIVSLAATLLSYINAIVQGWFGINLFSNGSAKNFQKMKAGASGVSKAVKEIKKQLAGFDEINKLTDQSDSGAGGGGAGGVMPDFDLSKMQGEPPAWLKWIIDNKDLILSVLAGVAGGLLAWKLGLDAIKSLGIGLLITGVIYAIQGLIEYLKNPTWKNFGKVIEGIGIAIIGLGAIVLGLPRNYNWSCNINIRNCYKILGTNKNCFTKWN